MTYFEYKDYPPIPKWLEEHILKFIEQSLVKPVQIDSEEYRNSLIEKAEKWINADQAVMDVIDEVDYNEEDTLGYHFRDERAYGYTEKLAKFDFIGVDKVIEDWVYENIPDKVIGVNLQIMFEGEMVTPHTDEVRHYALNYLFDTGGDNVETIFYQPLPEYQHLKIYPRTLIPLERIQEAEKVIIEPHRWHRIDVVTVHAVNHLNPEKKRISLSLSVLK